jgi:hypothetical protein
MSWRSGFESYAVPDAISQLGCIEDLSRRDDACPSFGRQWFTPDGEVALEIRLWIDDPDPAQRLDESRFRLMAVANNNVGIWALGESGLNHIQNRAGGQYAELLFTDDEYHATLMLVCATGILQYAWAAAFNLTGAT